MPHGNANIDGAVRGRLTADRLIVIFAVIVAVAAGQALLEFALPVQTAALFPFSEVYYERARLSQTPEEGVYWSLQAVKVAPGRAENWVLLATAYQREDKTLSNRALDALTTSYQIAPLSPDVHDWRLTYVFSNWSSMPPDLRANATDEAVQYARRQAGFDFLTTLQASVSEQAARDSLGILLVQAKFERLRHQNPAVR